MYPYVHSRASCRTYGVCTALSPTVFHMHVSFNPSEYNYTQLHYIQLSPRSLGFGDRVKAIMCRVIIVCSVSKTVRDTTVLFVVIFYDFSLVLIFPIRLLFAFVVGVAGGGRVLCVCVCLLFSLCHLNIIPVSLLLGAFATYVVIIFDSIHILFIQFEGPLSIYLFPFKFFAIK